MAATEENCVKKNCKAFFIWLKTVETTDAFCNAILDFVALFQDSVCLEYLSILSILYYTSYHFLVISVYIQCVSYFFMTYASSKFCRQLNSVFAEIEIYCIIVKFGFCWVWYSRIQFLMRQIYCIIVKFSFCWAWYSRIQFLMRQIYCIIVKFSFCWVWYSRIQFLMRQIYCIIVKFSFCWVWYSRIQFLMRQIYCIIVKFSFCWVWYSRIQFLMRQIYCTIVKFTFCWVWYSRIQFLMRQIYCIVVKFSFCLSIVVFSYSPVRSVDSGI